MSSLVIVIKDDVGDLTVPVIASTNITNKMISICGDNSLIGIKCKIDADEHGLTIKDEKNFF